MEDSERLIQAVQLSSDGMRRLMNRRTSLWVVTLFVAAGLLAGCHGDPNVRKQKYLESGKRYSTEGKYREAAIQFFKRVESRQELSGRSLRVGLTYVHLASSAQPTVNSRAQLTCSLRTTRRGSTSGTAARGGKSDDAQKQADAVMAAQPNNADVHALLSAIAVRRGLKDKAFIEMNRALELDRTGQSS